MASKGDVSYTNTNIELLEDGSIVDSSETSLEEINETISGIVSMFDLRSLFSYFNAYFYEQNTYKIYLGLNIRPPKNF